MTLEGVNKNEGKEGLLVNGKWYNPTERVRPYIAKCRKGETVYMEVDAKGLINFVGPAERQEKPREAASQGNSAPKNTPQPPNNGDKVPEIVWQMKDWGAMRGGLAHDAAQMLSTLQQTGAVRIASKIPADKPEAQREVLKLASELHEILLGHLVANNEAAGAKKRAELEMGSLKPQKKEPIEAEV